MEEFSVYLQICSILTFGNPTNQVSDEGNKNIIVLEICFDILTLQFPSAEYENMYFYLNKKKKKLLHNKVQNSFY